MMNSHDARTVVLAALLVLLAGCDGQEDNTSPGDPVAAQVDPAQGRALAEPRMAPTSSHVTKPEPIASATTAHLDAVDTSEVRATAVHDRGLMVATSGGLVVVQPDGSTQVLTRREGLRSHDLRSVFVDPAAPDGPVWIGFAAGGCQLYAPEQREEPLSSCPSELDSDVITGFAALEGAVHAMSWKGFHSIIEDGDLRSRYQGVPGLVSTIAQCGDTVWAGSRGRGIFRYETASSTWTAEGGSPRIVDALACVGSTLHAGGPRGLSRLESGAWPSVVHGGDRRAVTALEADGDRLFVGLSDGRVSVLSADSPPSLPSAARSSIPEETSLVSLPGAVAQRRVEALSADGLGAIWVAAQGFVGSYERGAGTSVWLLQEHVVLGGPGGTDVSDIASHDELVAAGFFRDGLSVRSGAQWSHVTVADGLPSNEVNAVTFTERGELWVATSRGIARLDPTSAGGQPKIETPARDALPCVHINDIEAVSAEAIVVGASCGAGVLDAETGELIEWWATDDGLPHRIVYSVAVHRGHLVLGTNDGIASRELLDPRWETHFAQVESTLEDNWITALATAPNGDLMVGTYSGGLYRGESFESLVRIPGPEYINLNAIRVVHDRIFVGGLSEGGWVVVGNRATPLDAASLPGRDVTAFAADGDGTLIATRSGIWRL